MGVENRALDGSMFFVADLAVVGKGIDCLLGFGGVAGFVTGVAKELRVDTAPAGIFGQNGFFCGGRFAALFLDLEQGLQGRNIVVDPLSAGFTFLVVILGETPAAYANWLCASRSPSCAITSSVALS